MTARSVAIRFDRTTQGPAGSLIIDGIAARVGVLEYGGGDPGGERSEYVSPEVLFAADSMASLMAAPVTIGHPPAGVTPETWSQHAVGHVSEVKADEEAGVLRVRVVVSDASAIRSIVDGDIRELSCGYSADYEERPGVTESGQRFDGVQLGRQYNHLAVVDTARAGRIARLYVDGSAAMKIKTKDGKEHKIPAWMEPAIKAAASERFDEMETGEVSIDGTQLILPRSMIDQLLAMLGAGAAAKPEEVEVAEVDEAPAPEGATDPAAAAPVAPPTEEDRADERAKQRHRERVIADALRAGVLPANYSPERKSTSQIMRDVIAAIDPLAPDMADLAKRADSGDAYSLGSLSAHFSSALKFRSDGVTLRDVQRSDAGTLVTHSISDQIAHIQG